MIQLKEEKIKIIVNADGSKSVEIIINNAIWDMQAGGVVEDVIMEFIQKLDLSLMLYKIDENSETELNNIKLAREILMNKILNGIDAQYSF
ncbi:MAG: hypothetical protein K8R85_00105 [Bacteroidetes bacterium]|nr:hypothetical protein [Bacteroidota bacterium]